MSLIHLVKVVKAHTVRHHWGKNVGRVVTVLTPLRDCAEELVPLKFRKYFLKVIQ